MEILAKLHAANPEKLQFYNRKGQPCNFIKTYKSNFIKEIIENVKEEIPDFKDILR